MKFGRLYKEDVNDWSLDDLHRKLALTGLPDPDLTESLGSAIIDSPYFQSWKNFRALWKYIKSHKVPTPIPSPSTLPMWQDSIVLDQGDYGTCVGNGWAGWGDCAPIEDTFDERFARQIYYEATIIDGQPDNPDEVGGGQQGSTVRSGAKAMQNRRKLLSYAFAKNMDEVDHWLEDHGSVVFGTDWTEDMMYPDNNGLIRAIGQVAGGHCYIIRGKDSTDLYRGRNSWGPDWADKGDFLISRKDLSLLLKGIETPGEACFAIEV